MLDPAKRSGSGSATLVNMYKKRNRFFEKYLVLVKKCTGMDGCKWRNVSCRGYAVGLRWLRQSSAGHLVILPRYITVGCYEDAEHAVNHSRPNIRWIIVFQCKELRNSWKLFFWQGWLPLLEDKLTQCPGEAFRGRDSLPNRDWVGKDPVQPLRETYRQRNMAAYPLVGGCATRNLQTHYQFKFQKRYWLKNL